MNTSVDQLIPRLEKIEEPSLVMLAKPLSASEAAQLASSLRHQGLHVATIDLTGKVFHSEDYEDFLLHSLDRGFRFPEYFGHNWNAVDECITDLGWIDAKGYCCILLGGESLRMRNRQIHDLFTSVLNDAGDSWREKNKPFHLVYSP